MIGSPTRYTHPRQSSDPPFVVSTRYVSGFPVLVTANGIQMASATYGQGGILASYTTGMLGPSVFTGNINTITTSIAPSSIQARPASIASTATPTSASLFASGTYSYDGSGNIIGIGSDSFSYDSRSRLTGSTVSGMQAQYGYDRYGNVTSLAGLDLTPYLVSSTNKLNKLDAQGNSQWLHDARGNLTYTSDGTNTFDALDRLVGAPGTPSNWKYYFDASSERIAKLDPAQGWRFTLRDEQNRVVTQYANSTFWRDNVYLGNFLVASFRNPTISDVGSSGEGLNTSAWTFYASDHLGSVRLVTEPTGRSLETRKYAPFGAQIDPAVPVNQRTGYAGMERDPESSRFYDHARTQEFRLGRFLSADQLRGQAENPQSWNRFTYALNNPLKYVDPDGYAPQEAVMVAVPPQARVVALGSFAASLAISYFVLDNSLQLITGRGLEDIGSPRTEAFRQAFEKAALEGTLIRPGEESRENSPTEMAKKGRTDAGESSGEEHTSGARPSTRQDHEDGQARKQRDRGGERADPGRRPPRKRPKGHKGPWPPAGGVIDEQEQKEAEPLL